ncbi:hypothetical protein CHKEEEPN_0524 [Methylorubrum podarium]|nr:hypothetical protein CHKEEEPN_0524 [Methylorubrum podarium]
MPAPLIVIGALTLSAPVASRPSEPPDAIVTGCETVMPALAPIIRRVKVFAPLIG